MVMNGREAFNIRVKTMTATGEPEYHGLQRLLAMWGWGDSLPADGDNGFNEVALECRQRVTKKPLVEDPQEDSGGQSNSQIAELESALASKDRLLDEAEQGFHGVNDDLNRMNSKLNTIRQTTDLIMVALEVTPTESIEDDLNSVGKRLHELVKKVNADESTPMGILRRKLKAKIGGVEAMWAELGHRPGYRSVIFSEDWLHLALEDEAAVDAWIAKMFEQLPADTTVVDRDDRIVMMVPDMAAGSYKPQYCFIVASKEWEGPEDGMAIPSLNFDMQGKLRTSPVEVAQDMDIDYSAVQTPVPLEAVTDLPPSEAKEQSSVAGSSPAGSQEP